MNSRERVKQALNHRRPDRVPIDFGGSAVTGIHISCVEKLRRHYGLEQTPVKLIEPYQLLGEVDDALRDAMHIDTVGVAPPRNIFGFRNEDWKEFRMPWNQVVLVPGAFRTTVAPNGDLLIYPEGDTSVPPSGRMPVGGYFFDSIIRQEPIDESRLDPQDNLEEFTPLSDADIRHYKTGIEQAARTGRATVVTFGGTGFGDIALVPAPFLKHPKGIRDVTEWYISTATRKDYVHEVFARQCETALGNLARIYDAVGNAVDVAFICGTDFGTQTSSFCSAATFDELYAPYYRRLNDWIHAHTTWKTLKHSCGAIAPFLQHFVDCGFDIINPVQCSAAGMDPAELKARHGGDIVFWGGGVDTQKTLPFGTPEAVRREVAERLRIFSPDGGFVFNAIHNVQARTPVENIVAMIETASDAA